MSYVRFAVALVLACCLFAVHTASAGSPLASLFKQLEADPNKTYPLQDIARPVAHLGRDVLRRRCRVASQRARPRAASRVQVACLSSLDELGLHRQRARPRRRRIRPPEADEARQLREARRDRRAHRRLLDARRSASASDARKDPLPEAAMSRPGVHHREETIERAGLRRLALRHRRTSTRRTKTRSAAARWPRRFSSRIR